MEGAHLFGHPLSLSLSRDSCHVEQAVVLGVHSGFMGVLVQHRGLNRVDELPMLDVALSASVAGGLASAICTPFEQIKSRAMLAVAAPVAQKQGKSLIVNELTEVRGLVKINGLRSLFRGLPLLLLRDCHGTAAFLGSYEWLKRSLNPVLGHVPASIVAGAISGPIGWIVGYPVEVVRIHFHTSQKHGLYRTVAERLYKTGGMRIFFRGLPMCCARSTVQIAATMLVFEQFKAACICEPPCPS